MLNREKIDLYRQFIQGTSEGDLARIYKIAPFEVVAIIEGFKTEEHIKREKEDYDKNHRQEIV